MATRIKLASATVGAGGASSIEFTSIPQNYDDIEVVMSARSDQAGYRDYVNININGATTNISGKRILGYDASSFISTGTTLEIGVLNGGSSTANTFSDFNLYIANYKEAQYKTIHANSICFTNGSSNNGCGLYTSVYSSNTAISSLLLKSEANTLQEGSTATLYGISKQ